MIYKVHNFNNRIHRDMFLIKGRLGNRLVAYIIEGAKECHIRRILLGYILHVASRLPKSVVISTRSRGNRDKNPSDSREIFGAISHTCPPRSPSL